ncbi:MAG: methyltransferase [Gammaproteobacteria bacterium HGW-Gammaproteobacteria-10]|nr:MAG: methyltransferase [Gammaproteobacteria bacterium HGW-Gammaproteobacteria-10]
MKLDDHLNCPLCAESKIEHFHSDKQRDYFLCSTCALVFVPPAQQLDLQQQKAVYDLHQNDVHDQGYRKFLSRFAIPLSARLLPGASGLDFGCGPGPALSLMLKEQGFPTAIYDPIYADYPEVLQSRYDFISCTEVVEHFTEPGLEFSRLFSMIKPQGILAIMTKRVIDRQAFAQWHYKIDPTHVCFFSDKTFLWLADRYRCRTEFIDKDVVILSRLS